MTKKEIIEEILKLPTGDQVKIMEALWQSKTNQDTVVEKASSEEEPNKGSIQEIFTPVEEETVEHWGTTLYPKTITIIRAIKWEERKSSDREVIEEALSKYYDSEERLKEVISRYKDSDSYKNKAG